MVPSKKNNHLKPIKSLQGCWFGPESSRQTLETKYLDPYLLFVSDPTWRHIWRRIHFKSHQKFGIQVSFRECKHLKGIPKIQEWWNIHFPRCSIRLFSLGIQKMTCQPNLGLQKAVADTGGEQNNPAKTHWFSGSGPHLEGVLQNITPFTTFSVRSREKWWEIFEPFSALHPHFEDHSRTHVSGPVYKP